MTLLTLSRRSLTYHARSHLGAILGAAVSAAVLIGALVVGDSVRESLKEMALARLGKVNSAIASNDRLFTDALATKLNGAAILQLPGIAVNGDGTARANQAQVLGVDSNFWKLAPASQNFNIPPDGVFINEALARHLNVEANDPILVRIQRPSQLSQDAPLAKSEDQTAAMRVNVDRVISDAEFGRFGLAASQLPPFNVYVDRAILQKRAGATNKANLLLTTAEPDANELKKSITPADVELDFRITPDGQSVELRSSRVFIDPEVVNATLRAAPRQPILTYFVNELRVGDRATPYSMVTAIGSDQGPDEIVINQWLADDLAAKAGDELTLKYYVMGPMRRLEEKSAAFKIKNVAPIQGLAADKTLMPDFPGLTDAENCRDWDTGFPIKTDAIRDKDEKYWDDYKGTPKAFVSLARGQELWTTRFGNITALRWGLQTNAVASEHLKQIQTAVLDALNPANVGMRFEPLRAQALAASTQGQDFGQLFLSFSFFLIVAALMLMALLFGFSIEQRAAEMGTMLAIGLSPKQVRRLLLFEGAGLALIGTILGVLGGILYAKGLLAGLSTIWKSAVGTSSLQAHILWPTIVAGAVASVLVAVGTLWWSIRREGKRPARELLATQAGSEEVLHGRGKLALVLAIFGFTGALSVTVSGLIKRDTINPGVFFGAGALLLVGAIATATVWMRIQISSASEFSNLNALGLRNIARRRKRSRAVLILLSAGAFIVASIGVFRLDSDQNSTAKNSGTGGFAFIGESALPIVHDLNSPEGREFYSVPAKGTNFQSVPFRVRAGDDASCLNLNKAQKPRLLGVNPSLLSDRFAFAGSESKWNSLEGDASEGIPAIGDAASIQWALKAKIGDTIDYEDERGRPFKIKLVGGVANSILQGNLVISEKHFIERFPTEAGYRMFLIDAPSNEAEQVGRELTRTLQDYGLELTRAADRLAAFNAVQNTYINTFQVLGGLGLLLGSFGLGVVVLRNVFERRGELALLQAVGFTPGRIRKLILGEHTALMVAGLFIGALAAIVAVLPQLIASRGAFPLLSLGITLAGVVIFGLAATLFATSLALRGNLLESLRNE